MDNILNILGLALVALMIFFVLLDFLSYVTDYNFTIELMNSAINNDDVLDAIYVYYDRTDFVSRIAKRIHYKKIEQIEHMIILYKLTN